MGKYSLNKYLMVPKERIATKQFISECESQLGDVAEVVICVVRLQFEYFLCDCIAIIAKSMQ